MRSWTQTNPDQVILADGGVDSNGNEVPSSIQFGNLDRQAPLRIALEAAFPDDPETRNTIQRQFDQARNEVLDPLDDGDNVGDVTQLFDDLDLAEIDDDDESVAEDDDNDNADDGDGDDNEDVAQNDDGNDEDDQDNDNLNVIDGSDSEFDPVEGAQELEGTAGNDEIIASANNEDRINALAGDDVIRGFGNTGVDIVDSGAGNDRIVADDAGGIVLTSFDDNNDTFDFSEIEGANSFEDETLNER